MYGTHKVPLKYTLYHAHKACPKVPSAKVCKQWMLLTRYRSMSKLGNVPEPLHVCIATESDIAIHLTDMSMHITVNTGNTQTANFFEVKHALL